jgi:lipopolysaccharide transport system permease protein
VSGGLRLAQLARRALGLIVSDESARRATGYAYAALTLVNVSFQEQHRRALLGLLWMLITPALFLAVYLPIFSGAVGPEASARMGGTYGFSLYVVIGFLFWTAFVEGFQGGAASLVSNPGLVQHSPIPLSMLPVVKVIGAMVGLSVGLVLVLGILILLGRFPGVRLLLLFPALALSGVFTLGLALLVSSIAIVFRDILQVISTLLLVQFFACPIIYLPEAAGDFQSFVELNPMTPFLKLVRASLLPAVPIGGGDLALACLWAGIAYAVGATVFSRFSRSMADYT